MTTSRTLPTILNVPKLIPRLSWSTAAPLSDARSHEDECMTFGDILEAVGSNGMEETVFTLPRSYFEESTHHKITLLGEQHHQPGCLALQLAVLKKMLPPSVIVMEHFNVTHTPLLAIYSASNDEERAFQTLKSAYLESSEGFDLDFYRPLFRAARAQNIAILGGFPDRQWAKVVFRDGVRKFRETLRSTQPEISAFDRWQDLRPSETHSALIQSMIRGGPITLSSTRENQETADCDNLKGLAVAQAFKDAFMAYTIDKAVAAGYHVLGICGSGHLEYDCGVIERLRSVPRKDVLSIIAKSTTAEIWKCRQWGDTDSEEPKLCDAIYLYEAV